MKNKLQREHGQTEADRLYIKREKKILNNKKKTIKRIKNTYKRKNVTEEYTNFF